MQTQALPPLVTGQPAASCSAAQSFSSPLLHPGPQISLSKARRVATWSDVDDRQNGVLAFRLGCFPLGFPTLLCGASLSIIFTFCQRRKSKGKLMVTDSQNAGDFNVGNSYRQVCFLRSVQSTKLCMCSEPGTL